MPTCEREGDVFIVDLGEDENRFNPIWVAALNAALDAVEAGDPPRAAVITARGKIWTNGLDLDWFAANLSEVNGFLVEVHELFARVLAFPIPTIAAIQGHCFAAGAMLSLACDERVMRADRGYWCLPEADINIPFTPGMSALIQARLAPGAAHQAMVTARRYGGDEAAAAGIVDRALPEDEVLPAAKARAAELAGKGANTISTIKQRMYADVLTALRDREANALPIPG